MQVNDIKKLVLIALISNDSLMEILVLKGGNAIDLFYEGTRASYDLDFSMEEDFQKSIEEIRIEIYEALETTLDEEGYQMIDFDFKIKPKMIAKEVESFWGGYEVVFKLIKAEKYASLVGEKTYRELLSKEKDTVRRNAVPLNPNYSTVFSIDISKYEYVKEKKAVTLDGYKLYIYPISMLIFEKVRAICQQLPEYAEIIKSKSLKGRARDFYDIYTLYNSFDVDITSDGKKDLLKKIFDAKKVPYALLKKMRNNRDLHFSSFSSVVDTVSKIEKEDIKDFDFYFYFVLEHFEDLLDN